MKNPILKPLLCAVGLCLGMNQTAWAATATIDFSSGFTQTGTSPNFSVSGSVAHPASGVTVTLTTASGDSPTTGQIARIAGTSLIAPSYPPGSHLTTTVTLSFAPAVTGLKLAVRNVANSYVSGLTYDEYLHSFQVNGSPISLPSQATYGSFAQLVSTSVAGGSGTAPGATPAYTGDSSDNGGSYLVFSGSVSLVSFKVQGNSALGIDSISFDYGSSTVNAPIDLNFNKQPETFASEIEIK
jgi:hypothetical protein